MGAAVGSARLFGLAASCWLGSCIALYWTMPRAALAAAFGCLLACLIVPRSIGIFVAAVCLGWLVACLRISSLQMPIESDLTLDLEGVIARPPRIEVQSTSAIVEIASGPLRHRRVYLSVRAPPWTSGRDVDASPVLLEIGDLVSIEAARIRPVRAYSFHQRITHLKDRVSARVYADQEDVLVTGAGGAPLIRVARVGRRWMSSAAALLPGQPRALLLGVTIGDVAGLDPSVSEDFRRTGLTHLVAVSGANVAIVLVSMLLVLRWLHTPVRVIPWILAIGTAAFCATSAFEPSVVRASVMATLVLWAMMLGAARKAVFILGATVLALALADPFLIFQLGFQLSVLATLGLVTLARRFVAAAGTRPVLLAACATLGAQLTTLPLLVAATGRLSLVSLPANLVTGPLVAPATVVGFVAASAGALVPPARYLAWLAYPFLSLMLFLARVLADLPLAVVSLPNDALGTMVIVALLMLLCYAALHGRRSTSFVVALALLVPLGLGFLVAAGKPTALEGLTITMLDVGQGEAILITEGGHSMLIDGGKDPLDAPRMLRDRGIHRLDYLVISHAHDDHISGLLPVTQRAKIGAILDPGLPASLPDYLAIEETARQRQIPWITARGGQRYPLGKATVTILWPVEPLLEGTDSDLNENSIVLRIDFGSDAFIYAGETQEQAQGALLELAPADIRGEVLKVSHHGSARMDPDFYAATGAEVALIPVGPNTYGHPAPLTLLALTGMDIYRSDLDGHVTVTLDGNDRRTIRTEK